MDLPTCPSCGQSVLEDDAVDCPFCGASMKGGGPAKSPPKPGAAKPATAPAQSPVATTSGAKARSASASASRPSSATSRGGRNTADDDDPFAADESVEKAIPLRPRPVKGAIKAVCPMCETAGYAPPKAAGKEVRCANPKCLVPIFTAPELPKKEAEPEAPPKTSAATWALLACVVLLVAAGGAAAWFFVFRDDPNAGRSGTSPGTIANSHPVVPPPGVNDTKVEPETVTPPPETTAKALSPAEIQEQALLTMIETSREQRGNRSKPFCRRLTAEAYALVGNLEEARNQVEQLQKVGPELPFYQVSPLTTIAWRELAAGNSAAAQQSVNRAADAAKTMLNFGRDPLDAATLLAAAQVAVGETGKAEDVIRKQRQQIPIAQLSLQLQTIREFGTYDLPALVDSEPLVPPASPHWATVAVVLNAHGKWDEGLAWVERQEGAEPRTDGIIVWAETAALFEPDESAAASRIEAAAGKLDPASRAKLYARIAVRRLGQKQNAAAEQALATAKSTLDSVAVPEPLALPEMKALYSMSLPDPVPLRTAAIAAAEIARAEALLGRNEAAWTSLEKSLGFLRAMTPSPAAIRQQLEQVDSASAFVRDQLAAALELDTDDKARRAFNNYRKQVASIAEASDARFQLQTQLLSRAAGWDGVRGNLWNEVSERAEASDLDRKEPYGQSSVPVALAAGARAAGNTSLADEISAAFPSNGKETDPEWDLQAAVNQLTGEGKLAEAASRIEKSQADRSWKLRLALLEASRLVKDGKLNEAYEFIKAFKSDPILREEAYELVSALAARRGDEQPVWKTANSGSLPPAERVAACRGLVAGMVARGSSAGDAKTASAP